MSLHTNRPNLGVGFASPNLNSTHRLRRARLAKRAAERRARVEAEGRETPEAMRAIMGEFAQMERDFAGLRRAVNKHIG